MLVLCVCIMNMYTHTYICKALGIGPHIESIHFVVVVIKQIKETELLHFLQFEDCVLPGLVNHVDSGVKEYGFRS